MKTIHLAVTTAAVGLNAPLATPIAQSASATPNDALTVERGWQLEAAAFEKWWASEDTAGLSFACKASAWNGWRESARIGLEGDEQRNLVAPRGAPKPIEAGRPHVNDADIAQLVVELRANRMEIIQNGTCAYMSPRPYGLWVNWHLVERAIAALQVAAPKENKHEKE